MMFKSMTFIASAFGLSLYASATPTLATPEQFVKYVLDQGGLVTAIAILLYFWRRDMGAWRKEQEARAAEKARESETLIDLVKENTMAMANATQAIGGCVGTLDRLTNVVDRITLDAAVTARRQRMPDGDRS